MKAISLWNPWAVLVMLGEKQWETRSWATDYRGPLVIHAAKHFTMVERRLCIQPVFWESIKKGGYRIPYQLPLGVYLAIVDLVSVRATEDVVNRISGQERAFGDYSPGRFAWKLENVRRFPEPMPARGYQGLWDPLKDADPAMKKLIEDLY